MKSKKKRHAFHEAMKARDNLKKQKLQSNTKQRENYFNKKIKRGYKNNVFKDERIRNIPLNLNSESIYNLNDGPTYQSDMLGTKIITDSIDTYDDIGVK